MIDFHCHLDLYTDPMKVFAEVNRRKTEVLAVTTSPRAFVKTSQYFRGADNVRVALGFHPELVKQRSSEKELFFAQMRSARFLGEIGIDGSQRSIQSISEQIEFFDNVVHTAAVYGGKILSIHSRGAVKEVLRILEKYEGEFIPVLHWFTGTIKDAEIAVKLGCWFSINPNMCYSTSGKKLIGCIPLDRMLPETDAPFTQIDGVPYMPWDNTVTSFFAKENRIRFDDMVEFFHNNLLNLLNKTERNSDSKHKSN